MPADDTSTWICPLHPFGHTWDHTALTCRCGHTRTPAEAIVSLLAGLPGWDTARAEQLVAAHAAASATASD